MMAASEPGSAANFLPRQRDLAHLRQAASGCQGCSLYRNATQTVFGEGPAGAKVLLVGEQPGDQEDMTGQPFVGPAGRLLERSLADAGFERGEGYLTNAVKHFKWEWRGRRRLHRRPSASEVRACRPWLEAEVAAVRPSLLVCLGVTATTAVLGRAVRLKDLRASFAASPFAIDAFITIHPSALLRLPSEQDRVDEYWRLVSDLELARARVA